MGKFPRHFLAGNKYFLFGFKNVHVSGLCWAFLKTEEGNFWGVFACFLSLLLASSAVLLLGNSFIGIRTYFFRIPTYSKKQPASETSSLVD